MTFEELYLRMQKDKRPPKVMLCLDPGHTTGYSVFIKGSLAHWGQIETITEVDSKLVLQWTPLIELFSLYEPTLVVYEDYRVYEHKLEQHTHSGVETLRLIGGIILWSWIKNVKTATHLAQEHKGFCTDKKLESWGYYKKGLRHSRDAIRLGCYHLLFYKGQFRED